MIGSVVGADGTLLALVLGLLVSSSNTAFTAQHGHLQTLMRPFVELDTDRQYVVGAGR